MRVGLISRIESSRAIVFAAYFTQLKLVVAPRNITLRPIYFTMMLLLQESKIFAAPKGIKLSKCVFCIECKFDMRSSSSWWSKIHLFRRATIVSGDGIYLVLLFAAFVASPSATFEWFWIRVRDDERLFVSVNNFPVIKDDLIRFDLRTNSTRSDGMWCGFELGPDNGFVHKDNKHAKTIASQNNHTSHSHT